MTNMQLLQLQQRNDSATSQWSSRDDGRLIMKIADNKIAFKKSPFNAQEG